MWAQLYEEQKYNDILEKCENMDGQDGLLYGYAACVEASRNNLSRLSLEKGIAYYEKAMGLLASEDKQVIFQEFTKQVEASMTGVKELIAQISLTPEITQSVRDCLKVSADAIILAVESEDAVLEEEKNTYRKLAVSYIAELCETKHYKVDLGKNVLNKTDHVSEEIRQSYVPKYDALVAKIKETQEDYVPQEIQREKPVSELTAKSETDGKKTLIDRLINFF